MRVVAAFDRILACISWALAAIAVLFIFFCLVRIPTFPAYVSIGALGFVAAAAYHPASAFLIILGIMPLLPVSAATLGLDALLTELAVVAFVIGSLARGGLRILDFPLERPLRLLTLVIMASTVVTLASAHWGTADGIWSSANQALSAAADLPSWTQGRLLLIGPMLMAASVLAVHQRPPVSEAAQRMFAAGAAGAAAMNLHRAVAAMLRSDAPLSSLVWLVSSQRINMHYADLNAAGSYFALSLPIAASLAFSHRVGHAVWGLPTALIAGALWLTGSRVAIAAVVAVGVAAAMLGRQFRLLGWMLLSAGAALLAGTLAWGSVPDQIFRANAREALMLRLELARASTRMFESAPAFGVGAGQFYQQSPPFMSEWLHTYYPRENAHNQFLQVLAELGVAGFVPFMCILGVVGARAVRRSSDRPPATAPFFAGLLCFLFSCLAGHPLLTPVVAYAFWTVLGVTAALSTPSSETRSSLVPRGSAFLAAAVTPIVTVAVLASVPLRLGAVARMAPADPFSGASIVVDDAEAWVVRQPFSFSVPRRAKSLDLYLRHTGRTGELVFFDVWINGQFRDRLSVDADWRRYSLQVPATAAYEPDLRFELRAQRAGPELPTVLARRVQYRP